MPAMGAPVTITGSSGVSQANQIAANPPYVQASNVALANPNGTAPAVPVALAGGRYIWDAQFTGTSLVLEALGADNATWRTTATLNASGTFATPIDIGSGTTMRVRAPAGATGVYSRLARVN